MSDLASSIVARLQSMVLSSETVENGNKGKPPTLSTAQVSTAY
jgi:hypothetical protein